MVFLSFEEALGGVLMATVFGLFWGYLTVKTGSVLPAMISHYLIDAFGAYLINVDQSNEEVMGQYFLLLILLYPLIGYILTRMFVSQISPNTEEINPVKVLV